MSVCMLIYALARLHHYVTPVRNRHVLVCMNVYACICAYAHTLVIHHNTKSSIANAFNSLPVMAIAIPEGAKLLGGNGLIKRNTKLQPLDIPLDYEIGLDITPNDKTENTWSSIVRFTATDKECCEYGSRIPGVWFYAHDRRLSVVDGHTGDGNSDVNSVCDPNVMTLQANKKHRLKMVFTRKTVSVWVNNKAACTNICREDRQVFKNVQVYVGDRWWPPAHATVENLYFKELTASTTTTCTTTEPATTRSMCMYACMR